ncbi:hypothetical protein AAMO2058_000362600 [Amorphochlora amoebiformis]
MEEKKNLTQEYPDLLAPLLIEFIGTFFLGLTICLSSSSYLAPLAIGGILMSMVFMGGRVSGAHFNPAVTLAVALCEKIEWFKGGLYVAAQFAGAISAAVVGGVIAKGEDVVAVYPSVSNGRYLSALVCEFLFTFILAKVVLNVAGHSKRMDNAFYGIAIGLTVFAGSVSVGDISGGAFNPAIGVCLPLVQGALLHIWVYIVGPCVGGAFAAFVFWATNGEEFTLAKYTPKGSEQLKPLAPYLMEGIGTFFLSFVFCMGGTQLLGPIAIGSILIAMVFMSGHISGSHFNPVITAAVWAQGGMELKKAGFYVLSQLIGAVLAGGIGKLLRGSDMGYPTISGGAASIPAALLIEMLITFALVMTVLHTTMSSKKGENSYYGLAIGMVVFAGTAIASNISGAAFNPAVGTALPFFMLDFFSFWLYWVAPMVGALAAAGVFTFTAPDIDDFDEVE